MEKKFSPLLFALGEKFSPKKLYFEDYILNSQSKQFKYLALQYNSENNLIEKIIINYLKNYLDRYMNKNIIVENIPIIPIARLK